MTTNIENRTVECEPTFTESLAIPAAGISKVRVRKGFCVSIDEVKGKWRYAKSDSSECGPEGDSKNVHPDRICKKGCIGMLVGTFVPQSVAGQPSRPQDLEPFFNRNVSDTSWNICYSFVHVFNEDGFLYFCMNDIPNGYIDNEGEIHIVVKSWRDH